jgi:tetratricopeptide (TPR) repeat protein
MKLRFCTWALLVVLGSFSCTATLAYSQAPLSSQIQVSPPPFRRADVPSATATAEELERKGDLLRLDKALLDALDYFRAALVKSPKNSLLVNKIGIVQLQLSRFPEARKSFETAIRLDRSYSDAYNNLGVVNYLSKDYGRAIKQYRKAINLQGDSAAFHNNLGAAYFARKDFPKAMAAYARALEIDPDVFEHTSRIGVAAMMSSPGDRAEYFYLLARMYARSGATERSLSYLRKAMEEGYKDINKVFRDEEFATVRKDPGFIALMKNKPMAITD